MTTKDNSMAQEDLAQFTGDLKRYRHSLNPQVIYTPGVQYLAEQAGAYWLIDAIASYIGTPAIDQASSEDYSGDLHFWRLDVHHDRSATLTARVDADVPPFVRQDIGYTDFPLAYVDIWAAFDGQDWTLYLPSEH